jgi:hypothetical protein
MLLAGCQTLTPRVGADGPVALNSPPGELPEAQLLDVAIQVFDPLPDEDDASGTTPEIREAEARFVPVHLKNTLQRSGHWGAVRVVPSGAQAGDVLVHGTIEASDGETLLVRISARDATGRRWFDNAYRAEVGPAFYRDNQRGARDAFQDLYNRVANDLAAARTRMQLQQLVAIRRVAELRFARDVAPDAFTGYLVRTGDDTLAVARLPAREDPMVQRVRALRERDRMLVDVVSGHYDYFYDQMWEPYQSWRRLSSEEAAELRRVESEATQRTLLGAAAILGAIVLGAVSDNDSSVNNTTLRNVMVMGGAMAVKSGIDRAGEARIHRDAIQEMESSFAAEVAPMVVELDGDTVELTGSAETQYASWRRLLKDIHAAETGLTPAPRSDVPPPARQP